MYLQLAENKNRKVYGGFSQEEKIENPYIFVPDPSGNSSGVWIREDYFDYLSPFEWRKLMVDLAPFQPDNGSGMSEGMFLNDRASRKAKREEKAKTKAEKKQLKNDKKDAKNKLIQARGEAKKSGRGADVLGSVIDGVKSIFGKPDSTATDSTTAPLPPDDGGGDGGSDEGTPFYKNPLVIGGGILVLAGGIYLATRKK